LPNGDELIAFSQSDLNPIDGFKGHNYDWTGNTWQTYGDNYLVFKSFNDSSAKIVGVSEAKYFGTADTRYCDEEIYDSILLTSISMYLASFAEMENTVRYTTDWLFIVYPWTKYPERI